METSWSYINSKRKTISGVAELHTKESGSVKVASTDEEKAEVLGDFLVVSLPLKVTVTIQIWK